MPVTAWQLYRSLWNILFITHTLSNVWSIYKTINWQLPTLNFLLCTLTAFSVERSIQPFNSSVYVYIKRLLIFRIMRILLFYCNEISETTESNQIKKKKHWVKITAKSVAAFSSKRSYDQWKFTFSKYCWCMLLLFIFVFAFLFSSFFAHNFSAAAVNLCFYVFGWCESAQLFNDLFALRVWQFA